MPYVLPKFCPRGEHDYKPAVTGSLFGEMNNVIYCSKCGDVRALEAPQIETEREAHLFRDALREAQAPEPRVVQIPLFEEPSPKEGQLVQDL